MLAAIATPERSRRRRECRIKMPFARSCAEARYGVCRDKFSHDRAQINHGLMTAENGFFGAARQENPAAPISRRWVS
jgi:hypothetical protein